MEEKIEISVKAETSKRRVIAFNRRVLLDGEEIYSDRISPDRYRRGKDMLSQFIALCEVDAGYRCDIRKKRGNALSKCGVRPLQTLKLRLQCLVLKLKIGIRKTFY